MNVRTFASAVFLFLLVLVYQACEFQPYQDLATASSGDEKKANTVVVDDVNLETSVTLTGPAESSVSPLVVKIVLGNSNVEFLESNLGIDNADILSLEVVEEGYELNLRPHRYGEVAVRIVNELEESATALKIAFVLPTPTQFSILPELRNNAGFVKDNYLVFPRSGSLRLFDLLDINKPKYSMDVVVPLSNDVFFLQDNFLYTASTTNVSIIDISDLNAPSTVGTAAADCLPYSLRVSGTTMAVMCDAPSPVYRKIVFFDITDPIQIQKVSEVITDGDRFGFLNGRTYSVSNGVAGEINLKIHDLAVPATPNEIGSIAIPNNGASAIRPHVYFRNDRVYIVNSNGIFEIDVADPLNLQILNSYTLPQLGLLETERLGGSIEWIADTAYINVATTIYEPKELIALALGGDLAPSRVPSAGVIISGTDRSYILDDRGIRSHVSGVDGRVGLQMGFTSTFSVGTVEGAALVGSQLFVKNGRYVTAAYDVGLPESQFLGLVRETLNSTNYGSGILADNGLLYVASAINGARILDIADPTNITEISSELRIGTFTQAVAKKDNFLFSISGDTNPQVYDVTNPANPVLVLATFAVGAGAVEIMEVEGNFLAIGRRDAIYLYDVSNPASPVFLSSLQKLDVDQNEVRQRIFRMAGNRVLSAHVNGLIAWDISDPLQPTITAEHTFAEATSLNRRYSISISGNYMFFPHRDALMLFDIGNPDAIQPIYSTPQKDRTYATKVMGNKLVTIGRDIRVFENVPGLY